MRSRLFRTGALASLEHVVVEEVEHDRDDRADHGQHDASRHVDEADEEAVNQVSAVGRRVSRHCVARARRRRARAAGGGDNQVRKV